MGLLGAAAPRARGFKVRVLRWRGGVAGASRSTRSTQSTRRGSLTLACGLVGRGVSSAGLMAVICLPGEVRRPVPGCYSPGGALGVLSVGADASLRAEHCFNRLWISFSSFSWICASQHSSSGNRLHCLGNSAHSSSLYSWAVWRMPLGFAWADSCSWAANWIWWFMGAKVAGSHCWASS